MTKVATSKKRVNFLINLDWTGFKQLAKVISRWQKLPLARKGLILVLLVGQNNRWWKPLQASKDRPSVKSAYQKINFLIFQPKHMLWMLKRTVSMSTQNICSNSCIRKYLQFFAKNFCLSKPMKEFVCLIWSLCPINNLSVVKGRVFLGWTSTKLGLMYLAQGHNAVGLEPAAPRSRVKHSTTEPLHSHERVHIRLTCKVK